MNDFPIHRPKRITSELGMGLPNTTKTYDWINPDLLLLTEIWNDMPTSWNQGGVVIAEPGFTWVSRWAVGKNYLVTKFFDSRRHLIGTYCDVTGPVVRIGDRLEFEDLYLDVWQVAGGMPELLDEDELEAAVAAEYVTPDEARISYRVAEVLIQLLKSGEAELGF